jgi:hypothetical protein
MQSNTKRHFGLRLALPAMLILAHPVIGFYDILPDAVGYLLLCVSLMRLSDLNERLSDALGQFKRMIWISLGIFILQYYVHHVLSGVGKLNPYEVPTMVLLGAFASSVLQICFALPAYRNFFLGMEALVIRHGGEELQGKSERMARRTGVFVVLSAILSALPELSVLTTFEFQEEKLPFDWYPFIGLFRAMVLMILIVLFLVWIVRYVRWWRALVRDALLMGTLEARYAAEVLPCTDMLTMRRFRFAVVFLALGSSCVLNLRIEQQNLFPSVFGAVLIAVGVLIFGEDMPQKKPLLAACAFLGAVSAGQLIFNALYTRYYSYEESGWDTEAYTLFLQLRLLEMLEALLVGILLCVFLRALLSFVRERVYERYGGEGSDAVSQRATERLQKRFRIRIYASAALFILAACCSMAELFFQMEYPWLWWIATAVGAVAIGCFVSLLYAVLDHLSWQASDVPMHKRD